MSDRRCPLTYQLLQEGQEYTSQGLRSLHRRLSYLCPLPFDAEGLRREALARADKLSIQGMQPKLSARLDLSTQSFVLADRGGTYILKPPHPDYPELPANEDVTMHMASTVGISVPKHGLVPAKNKEWVYFIQRFDRLPRGKKAAVEDFAQLTGHDRETKYGASMEAVVRVLDDYCTFPAVEKPKLFKRILFCFLTGNEDMHLKNFSLITRTTKNDLAPAYDYLNTTIALPNPKEELALPLRGRKNRLLPNDFFDYLGRERMGLNAAVIDDIWQTCLQAVPTWLAWIDKSFLTPPMKAAYADTLKQRVQRLQR